MCVAPGGAVGFEWQFENSSGTATWFEIDMSGSGGGGGSGAEAGLSLVAGESEWRALEAAARLAGGVGRGAGRAGCSLRQRLAVHKLPLCVCVSCLAPYVPLTFCLQG